MDYATTSEYGVLSGIDPRHFHHHLPQHGLLRRTHIGYDISLLGRDYGHWVELYGQIRQGQRWRVVEELQWDK